ncbi:histidinol-phosphatase [Anaerotignum lactatifermentans]|uniref:Histidinol-phosphatase n=1 Tax=Anaerotignum lactatifermentans TaxID=160404 RepID=A0ABS2GAF0_9FIRM|nr:histidinol-phosphatase [Anaerotignum lactatifermentans]MBM6829222.1 histidinol-phosphatase [Anaerotignum lactatifermentans]MBM6877538.1 histidinol-phosphatase [Anaerotignum lactatifermentans]MBM6950800.1 histidinol-phosphatase [Anaerotignum lactatifermentans]
MIPKANFHTHTTYCDGKCTVEEMVRAAYEKGFSALGFSGHSYTAFDESYCMSKEGVKNYLAELAEWKAAYAGKMEIYAGVEQDYYSEESTAPFDYVIGSVHYLCCDGRYYDVDESSEKMERVIREYFGGAGLKYAAAYFAVAADVVRKTGADIIGHFDLVTKFNEGNRLFDTESKAYRFAALEAMEALLETGKPFEINTGAMYRGLRTEPYPSFALLKELRKRGGKILLSSDSHDTVSLGFGFEETAVAAREAGFSTALLWTPVGMKEYKL